MKSTLIDHNYDKAEDLDLRSSALSGDQQALEKLITRHYAFIYNVALKMVLEPADAEDVAQEIVIKLITHLGNFKGESSLRTWLYRIVVNHILNMKQRHCEKMIHSFQEYGDTLDAMPNSDYPKPYRPDEQMVLDEIKFSCTAGMLMCLDRKQRLIYVLGEVFEIDQGLGAELLNISRDNYRQQLSRARHQLSQFMNDKCGLINKKNPCRCSKKARAFIDQGIVHPDRMVYNHDFKKKIYELLPELQTKMTNELEEKSAFLFRDSPFQERKTLKKKLLQVMDSDTFRKALGETLY